MVDLADEESVGKLSVEVSGDTAKLEEDVNKGLDKVEKSTTDTANKINAEAQKTSEKIGRVVGKVKSNAENAGASIKETANNTAERIEAILNDTARSEKSKVMAIASLYRKQGLIQSQAMAKAWEHIERTSKSSNKNLKQHSTDSTKKVKKNAQEIKTSYNSIGLTLNRLENKFKAIGTAVASAFSVAVVTAFTKKCIESTASVKALNSQFEQTFGNMQSNAKKAMQEVAKNSGIVQSRLQGVGTSIYAFAKTTGMNDVTALKMMQEALQITADSAAYYDRSLEDTGETLKSFLKGNYENDSALGLSCTETTRNTMANKLYGKSFIELSESQKQLALLQMVKEANQLSGAIGQASREADGWENVTGNLKESWKQLLAVIGQPILQVATQAIKRLTLALQTLTGYAQQAVSAMYEVFGWEKDSTSNAFSSVVNSADNATESIEATTKANEKLKNSLSGFDKLNVLSQNEGENKSEGSTATPIQSANFSVSPIDTSNAETSFGKITKRVKELLTPLKELTDKIDWEKIRKSFSNLKKSLEPFKEKVGKGLKWFWDKVLEPLSLWVANKLLPAFLDTLSSGLNVLDKVIEKAKPRLSWLWEEILEPIADWTGGIIVSVLDKISGVLDRIAQNEKAVDILSKVLTASMLITSVLSNPLGAVVFFSVIKKKSEEVAESIKEKWQGVGVFFYNAKDWFNEKVIQPIIEKFKNFKDSVKKNFFETWTSIKETFKPAETFFSNLWDKVRKKFTSIGTVVGDAFSGAIKAVVNSILSNVEDKVNFFVNAINNAIDHINTIPGVSISKLTRLEIPKLAKGGLIKAPTLALVGDNAGANNGNPEVVAPLNKLKGMLNESDGSAEDTAILSQILQYLIKIYEAIISDGNTNVLEIIAKLDDSVLFKRMIELNSQYKKRHGGKSAFA